MDLKKYKVIYAIEDFPVRLQRIVKAESIGSALKTFKSEFPDTSVYEIMEC